MINSIFLNKTISDNYLEEEQIYDVFPKNYSIGIKSADTDGSSLVIGSSKYGEVYSIIGENIKKIFKTQSSGGVHYILNLSRGINLAAIDDKLYLLYSSKSKEESQIEQTTTTTTTLITDKTISITYPNGGENLVVGEPVVISWTSSKSLSDVVKIELYDGESLYSVINPQTTNDGEYEWIIPPEVVIGNNYKIKITWLSANKAGTTDSGISTNSFSIVSEAVLTTTTTTTFIDLSVPDVSQTRGIPILELSNDYITYMCKDVSKGGILISTYNGRILYCDETNIFDSMYFTGIRKAYADVKDGFGNISDTAYTQFLYALYNKISEINENKEVVKYKFSEKPTAISTDKVSGIFLSPILYVKEDLGFWKSLIWSENKPTDTEIIISVRSGKTIDELKLKEWTNSFSSNVSETSPITRSLDNINLDGQYIQFKILMDSYEVNITPTILNLSITYSTKFAIYFFTTRFELERDSNVNNGLIVASITEPQNTEVKIGVTDKNSNDWNDYQVVETNKFFDMNSVNNIKVGIKMIAYDTNIPEVSEFALLIGSAKDNEINDI